jgi:DNA invertase Pin-like site-specific DNA recombinase
LYVLRIVGYLRCSTSEQATDGLSLEAQRSKITAWCELSGATLVEVVEDAGVSGTRPLERRPGGVRIASLLAARRPDADAVAVVRLDRLGRDAAETLTWLRRFSVGAVGLVSIMDRVDLATPQGRAMAQVGAVFSELERALIGERTAEALRVLRDQRRVYGPTPFGFQVADGHLVAEPAEQRVLRHIIRQRESGDSYATIAEKLNRRGVRAKRGGRWHAMSVRSVLKTHAWIGVADVA